MMTERPPDGRQLHLPFERWSHDCRYVTEGDDLFIALDGQRIAKRDRSGSPDLGGWIMLVPGYSIGPGTGGGLVINRLAASADDSPVVDQ